MEVLVGNITVVLQFGHLPGLRGRSEHHSTTIRVYDPCSHHNVPPLGSRLHRAVTFFSFGREDLGIVEAL